MSFKNNREILGLGLTMKIAHLTVSMLFCILLCGSFAVAVEGDDCKENPEYGFMLCGDWDEYEIDDLMTSLLGDENIHKIIKENENLYFLHTCESKVKENDCVRGLVQVIDRSGPGGGLSVSPPMTDWYLPINVPDQNQ